MILAFSDGATEAQSPAGEQLTHGGFLGLAEETLRRMREPVSLTEFSKSLLGGVQVYRGGAELEDDVTLLTLRRVG
jgi:serine phosphatase RsbU (regulator of sigma subunit)